MAGDELNQTPKQAARGDGTDQLPDDVLADIFRCVPPRWLAAARCVCRAWHDAIDSRGLLRADLLPLSLVGLFVHFIQHKFPEFLARPASSSSSALALSGDLTFLPSPNLHLRYIWNEGRIYRYRYHIVDHCNGLLLLQGNYVVNPATRRWHTLPTCPPPKQGTAGGIIRYRMHLVYDPMMISPYYQVVMIPTLVDHLPRDKVDPLFEESEWPPSDCKMHVFSSNSGCWEERDFSREGDAAGIVRDMRTGYELSTSIYFREALYVHRRRHFLMRISLSNNTYRVTKEPVVDKTEGCYPHIDVARSEKGVYLLALHRYWLRVWVLNESSGQMEWVLKHDKDLKPMLARHRLDQRVHAPWILEDINYNRILSSYHSPEENSKPITTQGILEWNSDDDDDDDDGGGVENGDNNGCYWDIKILGLHPFREVVFLSSDARTGLAYHLNSSKTEILGNIYPKEYDSFKELLNEGE